jgi:hypothetical protein
MRYIFKTIKTSSDKTRLQTTLPPNIFGGTFIETISLERLDVLAKDFYNDPSMWWVIASANSLGKGSLVIPPGTILRIPNVSDAATNVIRLNSTR